MWNITKRIQEYITEDDIVLDVGCGKCNPTRDIKARVKIGIDLFRPALGIAGRSHVPFNLDIRDLHKIMLPKTVDVALWLDCMEHMEVNDAVMVLEAIENIARKYVILHYPVSYFTNTDTEGFFEEGNLQAHRSHLQLGFFQERGYHLVKKYNSISKHPSYLLVKMLNPKDVS